MIMYELYNMYIQYIIQKAVSPEPELFQVYVPQSQWE